MKGSGVPLPPLGLPKATRLAPCMGIVSAAPKDSADDSPPGRMMLSAENTGNFPLKRASTRACCWTSPATRCPRGSRRAGSGAGPRQRRLPPTVPGAPLRLRRRHNADAPCGMIVRLQQLHEHLSKAERDELVALERERMAAAFRWIPVRRPRPGPGSTTASKRSCVCLRTGSLIGPPAATFCL
jgi:hypothetical protein